MTWLDEHTHYDGQTFTRDDLSAFEFEGERVALMDHQRGIRKPAKLRAALSIRTTFTPEGQAPPYEDRVGPDGFPRYKYQGVDPLNYDNVAVRQALVLHLPLIWFVGVARGRYLPVYPVWVIGEEVDRLQFTVALDRAEPLPSASDYHESSVERRYVERLTKQRLHQPVFRAQVLEAYDNRCAICRLRHVPLLDAAHILPDSHPNGLAVVPNGLSLCKIHHAAFDQNLIGVRPDLIVEIHPRIRGESDGPMLLHGLQEMHGTSLSVPTRVNARPDQERLAERYKEFLRAG